VDDCPLHIANGLAAGLDGVAVTAGNAFTEVLFEEVQVLELSSTIIECEPGVNPLKEVPD
jgi:hypothetical protein